MSAEGNASGKNVKGFGMWARWRCPIRHGSLMGRVVDQGPVADGAFGPVASCNWRLSSTGDVGPFPNISSDRFLLPTFEDVSPTRHDAEE